VPVEHCCRLAFGTMPLPTHQVKSRVFLCADEELITILTIARLSPRCCRLLFITVCCCFVGQGRMSAARGESWTLLEHVYDMRVINSNRCAHERQAIICFAEWTAKLRVATALESE
jgi:hypothetical protein